jgi:hypothetical protein
MIQRCNIRTVFFTMCTKKKLHSKRQRHEKVSPKICCVAWTAAALWSVVFVCTAYWTCDHKARGTRCPLADCMQWRPSCFILFSASLTSSVSLSAPWLRAGRSRDRSSIPVRINNYFLHFVKTDCGAHPTSYPMGTGGQSGRAWN